MISRRDKLLQQPWEQLRYAQHREKVMSARPAIDTHSPRAHEHVQRKWKKQQVERERQQQIERENLRLLQKLGDIMRTKRINNLWLEPRPNGNPERTQVAIPEQRTPWAPERKSWNRKTQEHVKPHRCYHCGSVKTSERKYFEEFSYSYSYDE
ncbi:GD18146 [Drosophila simulans]|uniref:GD18146 n=1 Tax=Drosophila simulans TaxID=7240 RepID=B4QW29_DROSI|nr:GD18146 [Drosophila simulans]